MEKVRLFTLLQEAANLTSKQRQALLNKHFRLHTALSFGPVWHREVPERREQSEIKYAGREERAVDYRCLDRLTIDLMYSYGYAPIGLRFHFMTRQLTIVLDKETPIPESKEWNSPQEAEAWIVAHLLELLLTPVNAPKVKEPKT